MQKGYQFRIFSLHQLENVYERVKNLKKTNKPQKPTIYQNQYKNRKSVNE